MLNRKNKNMYRIRIVTVQKYAENIPEDKWRV